MFNAKVKIMTKFLTFLLSDSIAGITLCPFGIYLKPEYLKYEIVINHESIHWNQQKEMLVIFFYI